MRLLNSLFVLGLFVLISACGKSEGDVAPPALTVSVPTGSFPIATAFGPVGYPGPYVFGGTLEAGSSLHISVNTTATIANLTNNGTTWSAELQSPAQGVNTVTVSANDQRGNINMISFSVYFDSVAPSLTYDQYVTPSALANQTIGGTVEAGATVTLDGYPASVVNGYWSYGLTGLTAGTYSLMLSAVDQAGNSTTLPVTLSVDPGAPAFTVDAIAATAASGTTLSGTYTAGYTVEVLPGGSQAASAVVYDSVNGRWSCVLSNLAGGNNIFSVNMLDSGNQLVATGKTVIIRDVIAPAVSTVIPTASSSVHVADFVQLSVLFSELLDGATISSVSVTLQDANNLSVAGTVSYDATAHEVTFIPSTPLSPGTYRATITNAITDLVGNNLANDYVWTFVVVP